MAIYSGSLFDIKVGFVGSMSRQRVSKAILPENLAEITAS